MTIEAVLSGAERYHVEVADRLDFLQNLPADSVDLVFGSPPYEAARTYGIDFTLKGEAWVAWMVQTYLAASRVCKGLVAFVVEGQTRNYRWSATPAMLMAELHKFGLHLRKPPIYHRVGIPGSGGPDWLRNDYEFIVCTARPGKLPWSDNTAMGHVPKWAPGGEMSHRMNTGKRVNAHGVERRGVGVGGRRPDGRKRSAEKDQPHSTAGYATSGHKNGDTPNGKGYNPPVLANPGNVIQPRLNLAELIDILIDYEQTTQTTADQVLRDLRQADSAGRLREWFYGVCFQVRAAALLRSSVCGAATQEGAAPRSEVSGLQQPDTEEERRVDQDAPGEAVLLPQVSRKGNGASGRSKTRRTASPGAEDSPPNDSAGGVREVSSDEQVGSTPPRRGRDKQRSEQPPSLVSVVSSEGPQERRLRSVGLYQTLPGLGILRQALPALQEAWRSASQMFRAVCPDESSNLIHVKVGGGLMGSPLASLNEAPFGEALAEFFVRSYCPPGGIVVDPFSGSGTTCAVSVRCGRRFVGCDIRESQIDLTRRRMDVVTPEMFS